MAEPKPLRADARRNRARVLAAAETVFGAQGTSASTEDVAKQAGVGIGTVFRHFPTKEALLEAVLIERMQSFAEAAQRWLGAEDPGGAFFAFLDQWLQMATAKNAFSDALAAAGANIPRISSAAGQQVRESLRMLLGRAQEAGAVRQDVGVGELIALLVGTSRAVDHLGPDAEALRKRTAEIMFDGLRPQSRE